jgi:hypothetical protein
LKRATSREHPAYELLADFFEKHFSEDDTKQVGDRPATISFVFERSPLYPILRFSVLNAGRHRIQISNIRVFKVASAKDEHGPLRELMGPRMKLDFNLKSAKEGHGVELFKDKVSNLEPAESEAFQIELDSENTVSLIDFEAEYVVTSARKSQVARPQDVVLVHAPTDKDVGQIAVLDRRLLFQSILTPSKISLWRPASYQSCQAHEFALLRGAATLGFDEPLSSWDKLKRKFEASENFGFILASYADALEQGFVPEVVKTFLSEWISDPKKIRQATATDYEAPALTVSRALAKQGALIHSTETPSRSAVPCSYEIGLLDRMLEVSTVIDEPDDDEESSPGSDKFLTRLLGQASFNLTRADLLNKIAKEEEAAAVEFLVATLVVQPQLYHEVHDVLCRITRRKKEITHVEKEAVADWWAWWQAHERDKFKALSWRELSPRLTKAFNAYQTTDADALTKCVLDEDGVVRYAAARAKALTPSHLEILARDERPMIRLDLVENPRTPVTVLRLLAADKNSIVRRWISKNPNVDDTILEKLERDPVPKVREFAQKSRQDT